ncbi:hypothetical protein [Streptomyces humi]
MSDDQRPDNVLTLPRIGSPPPPDLPPAPDLSAPAPADPGEGGGVRISPWDAPEVPHAPTAPDGAAVLRSEGSNPPGPADAGAPRAGALSLAAVLAIALAAFEGMQTWIQEAVPLRAEAARHRREIELLAAKATADAHRLGAEASGVRRRGVPSGHDYGRSMFGGGSGGRGRGGAAGTGTFGRGSGGGLGGRSGPGRASSSTLGSTGTGRTHTGRTHTGSAGHTGPSGRGGGSAGGGSSRTFAGGARNSGGPGGGSSGGPGNGSRSGARNGGFWGGARGGSSGSGAWRNSGTSGSGGSRNSGASGGSGGSRRSMGRKVADWWSKGSQGTPGGARGGSKQSGTSGSGTGTTPTASKGALHNAVRRAQKGKAAPTFWEAAGDQLRNRWKGRQTTGGTQGAGGGSGRAAGTGPGPVNNGWKPGGRTTFFQAVVITFGERWEKRREDWKTQGGPRRRTRTKVHTPPDPQPPGPQPGSTGDAGYGDWAWRWARASAFDTGDGPLTVTVEQDGPARAHGTRWEPTPIAPARPQLPRAPQRPAGSRPGTTRPKEAIPMPPASPARTGTAGVPAAVAMPGRMAAQHATEITLGGALDALSKLVSRGLTTYDACVELGRQARRLLAELELMAADLAVNHNVTGTRTRTAHAELMEAVTEMVGYIDRMAKASLAAAETAEAEETAMARHYRPTQEAAQDAGLHTPSARVHNEN